MQSTREALGVGDRKWQSCNMAVHWNLMGDWMRNFDSVLPEMLADGVKMNIYAGEYDLICNYLGNKRWVSALPWDGNEGWNSAPEKDWMVEGQRAGSVQSYGPLTFTRVAKAGHMVPMDQPVNSLAMITSFTRDKEISSALSSVGGRAVSRGKDIHSALDELARSKEQAPQRLQAGNRGDNMGHIHA
eukprot:gene17886-24278_t